MTSYLVRGGDGCFDLDRPGQGSVQGVGVGHVLVDARNETIVPSTVITARDLLIDEIVVAQG